MNKMKRLLGSAAAGMLMAVVAATSASAQQAQYSAKDIIDAFAKKPASQQAQPAPGECEKMGEVAGDDGTCEPARTTRGFSLPKLSNPKAKSAAAAATDRTSSAAVRQTRPAPAAPTVRKDLLITFKLGSAELTDQAKANAAVFARAVNSPALADARFDLSGYTDASGDKDKNLALSKARAAALKSFLVSQGVRDDRVEAQGYGASDFAADPMSPRNRRVEARRTR